MPNVAITTDLIVGFCGETDEEFQRSYDLIEELQFDKVHAAAYSDRPGTIAHRKLQDDVPQEVKMARFHKIEQLEAGISSRINSSYLGQEVEVLVEGKKPNVEGDDMWYGRNRQNKLVHFSGDSTPGDLVTVRIEHASPWSLVGTAIETRVPA